VIDAPTETGTIAVGSKVSYRDGEKVNDVTIVHPLEADLAAGKLSSESPVGLALLGAAKGDTVKLETQRGSKQLEIVDIG
jgi:transcription elongation factor GreA